jgi:hypothetical protein
MTMTNRNRQSGAAMVIGLIMLLMLTLIVVSAINSGAINLRISGNMQAQDEARSAAQHALENFVSSYANFYPTPAGPITANYDVNNAGTSFYSVTVAKPVCKRAAQQIPPRIFPDCANGVKFGLYCWDTLWEVAATSVDTRTNVSQQVVQGVKIAFPPAFVPSTVGC